MQYTYLANRARMNAQCSDQILLRSELANRVGMSVQWSRQMQVLAVTSKQTQDERSVAPVQLRLRNSNLRHGDWSVIMTDEVVHQEQQKCQDEGLAAITFEVFQKDWQIDSEWLRQTKLCISIQIERGDYPGGWASSNYALELQPMEPERMVTCCSGCQALLELADGAPNECSVVDN